MTGPVNSCINNLWPNVTNCNREKNKLKQSWAKLKLSLSYIFINFELTFKNFSGVGWSKKYN